MSKPKRRSTFVPVDNKSIRGYRAIMNSLLRAIVLWKVAEHLARQEDRA